MYLEKNKTRAKTRFNLEKKKIECSKYFWLHNEIYNDENLIKRIGKMAHNPKNCSCWMCGNPRRRNKGRIKGRISLKEEVFNQKKEIEIFLKYNKEV